MTVRMEKLACALARKWHKDQVRKYTGESYSVHLAEVAALTDMIDDVEGVPRHVIRSVAWLHDAKEDQHISDRQMRHEFRECNTDEVKLMIYGVNQLSDLDKGNRSMRVVLSAARLIKAPGWIQSIKCCDLTSNTKSIALHDPGFATVYLPEKRLLLDCLTKADLGALQMARGALEEAEAMLVQHNLAQREGTSLIETLIKENK